MITKQIVLTNYEWVSDEAAVLNACLRDNTLYAMLTACIRLNILGFTSIDNGHSGDDCVGYVEFYFAPEDEMLYTLGLTA
jgi:hypothetical protein